MSLSAYPRTFPVLAGHIRSRDVRASKNLWWTVTVANRKLFKSDYDWIYSRIPTKRTFFSWFEKKTDFLAVGVKLRLLSKINYKVIFFAVICSLSRVFEFIFGEFNLSLCEESWIEVSNILFRFRVLVIWRGKVDEIGFKISGKKQEFKQWNGGTMVLFGITIFYFSLATLC